MLSDLAMGTSTSEQQGSMSRFAQHLLPAAAQHSCGCVLKVTSTWFNVTSGSMSDPTIKVSEAIKAIGIYRYWKVHYRVWLRV